MNSSDIKIKHLLLILGLVILIIPPILTFPSFSKHLDFSLSGQIGDTLGGITAPFINAIGAVLVFVAFKEQIKANNLIKEQQYFDHIQSQIHRLEDDFLNLGDVIDEISTGLHHSRNLMNNFVDGKQAFYGTSKTALNKAIYSTTVFELTLDIIEKSESNREFLLKKIRVLYLILYQDKYIRIFNTLDKLGHMNSKTKNEEAELLNQIKKIHSRINVRDEEVDYEALNNEDIR